MGAACSDGCLPWQTLSQSQAAPQTTSESTSRPGADAELRPLLPFQARIAARQNDAETLHVLVTTLKRDISGLDEQGRTLLFYAVRGNRDDAGMAQVTGPAGVCLPGTDGQQWDDVTKYLVRRHNFDVNFQMKDTGMTALMEAARFGNPSAVASLLELQANPGLRTVDGLTALDIAKSELPKYLLFQEMQCSESRLESVKENIRRDRSMAARVLQAMQ
eukprot:TRINITY_DN13397_c0_g1_i1.p1 TRINITY_DN13397_c0_g1~~TRINITY_DN13397_c0_g1_i1.p1  ORF type:complete len:218 (+),score=54.27 TRINITY_DN13397_c0_g1_i1:38-691(+)